MLFEMTARKSAIFSDQRLHFYQILKSICPHHLILFVVAVKKLRENLMAICTRMSGKYFPNK